jgi:hypothetical protein
MEANRKNILDANNLCILLPLLLHPPASTYTTKQSQFWRFDDLFGIPDADMMF